MNSASKTEFDPFIDVSKFQEVAVQLDSQLTTKIHKIFDEFLSHFSTKEGIQAFDEVVRTGIYEIAVLFAPREGINLEFPMDKITNADLKVYYPSEAIVNRRELKSLVEKFKNYIGETRVESRDYNDGDGVLRSLINISLCKVGNRLNRFIWGNEGIEFTPGSEGKFPKLNSQTLLGREFMDREKIYLADRGQREKSEAVISNIFARGNSSTPTSWDKALNAVRNGQDVEYRILFNYTFSADEGSPKELSGKYACLKHKVDGKYSLIELTYLVNRITQMVTQYGYKFIGDFIGGSTWNIKVEKEVTTFKHETEYAIRLSILMPFQEGGYDQPMEIDSEQKSPEDQSFNPEFVI